MNLTLSTTYITSKNGIFKCTTISYGNLFHRQLQDSLSLITQSNVLQLIYNWQNTGYKRLFFNSAMHNSLKIIMKPSIKYVKQHDKCPSYCDLEIETPMHFVTCQLVVCDSDSREHCSKLVKHLWKLNLMMATLN